MFWLQEKYKDCGVLLKVRAQQSFADWTKKWKTIIPKKILFAEFNKNGVIFVSM